ncbi:beta-glucoside-specific PTS transporter subunit IIABC [Weissella cibaria]
MDEKKVATEVVSLIGGKENVSYFSNCTTRLRFNLVDSEVAESNKSKIEAVDGVIGVVSNAQFQVIIGPAVNDVAVNVKKELGDISENASAPKEKQSVGSLILEYMMAIFQPLVPAMAGGGVLKSMLILLAMMGVMDKTSNTYEILTMVGDAPLYFLPILVAFTAARKFQANELVAMSAVGTLLLPNMTDLLAKGANFAGFGLTPVAYAYQIFPALLMVFLYIAMEKLMFKISPKPIAVFFVPMVSLAVTVPIVLMFLGPLGLQMGNLLATVIVGGYTKFGWIATAALAAILPLMISVGMHKAMLPYATSTMSKIGYDPLYLPASLGHNISESGAAFAVSLKTKDTRLKQAAVSAGISALFGITEPAIYGVTLLHKRVLTAVMISSAIGGAAAGFLAIKAFALVGPELASISMFADENNSKNLLYAAAVLGLSMVTSFVAALVLYKDEVEVEETQTDNLPVAGSLSLMSPVKGLVIPLSDVKDDVFSSGMVGDGVGIVPDDNVLVAPTDAEVTMVFETGHAIGLKTSSGAEILLHIGLDTVQMAGDGFNTFVKVGDKVTQGQPLIDFDVDKIVAAGYDPTIIVVITNQGELDVSNIAPSTRRVTHGTPVLAVSVLA